MHKNYKQIIFSPIRKIQDSTWHVIYLALRNWCTLCNLLLQYHIYIWIAFLETSADFYSYRL